MFNLKATKAEKTVDFTVPHPKTGEDTSWVITFAGPGHEKAIKQKNAMINRALRRQRTGNRDVDAEDADSESVDFIVQRIVGWRGYGEGEGEDVIEVPFSEEKARSILADPEYTWLRNKLNAWLTDDASFIARSAKT